MHNRRTKATRRRVERARPTSKAPGVAAPQLTADDRPRRDDDDLEDSAPPLSGKVHPAQAMHFVVRSSDDEDVPHPHHPNETATAEFDVNPDAADAARDLAGDLGAQFLEGVTFGEDVSERAIQDAEANDAELPFLFEADESGVVVGDEAEPRGEPGPFAKRRRPRAGR